VLREKISTSIRRIPERIVHARGSAAHDISNATRPDQHHPGSAFRREGKRTPSSCDFQPLPASAVRPIPPAMSRVRGEVLYDEGNWDLVGNNIPVFFIQDAMKFPISSMR